MQASFQDRALERAGQLLVERAAAIEVELHTIAPGDVVLIPPGRRQRITCLGDEDLIFLAICTPRFRPETYEDIE